MKQKSTSVAANLQENASIINEQKEMEDLQERFDFLTQSEFNRLQDLKRQADYREWQQKSKNSKNNNSGGKKVKLKTKPTEDIQHSYINSEKLSKDEAKRLKKAKKKIAKLEKKRLEEQQRAEKLIMKSASNLEYFNEQNEKMNKKLERKRLKNNNQNTVTDINEIDVQMISDTTNPENFQNHNKMKQINPITQSMFQLDTPAPHNNPNKIRNKNNVRRFFTKFFK